MPHGKFSLVSIHENKERWAGITQFEVVDGRGKNASLIKSFYGRKEAEQLRDEINVARRKRFHK